MPSLRATRYLTDDNRDLARFIVDDLHYLDYTTAMRFYREIEPTLSKTDMALLGCNDRFFLLVALLDRADMRHPWLYDRCREVEASPDNHLDLWGRFHFKSSIITTGGVIQEVLCNPELTVSIFSFNRETASVFVEQIKKEFEENETILDIYPDVLYANPRRESKAWSKTKLLVKRRGNPKEMTIEANGLVIGMPTGRHYGLLVYDDIVVEDFVQNPDIVQKVIRRWELSDNLGVGEGTRKWMVGTRYSFGDPYAEIMKRGVVERLYPSTDDGTMDGTPVLYSQEWWEKIKETQRAVAAAQHLQNPLAGSNNIFMPEWFKAWEVRPRTLNVYIMCDPGKGETRAADRTAIAVIGIDSQGVKYLLDGYRHRMPLSERWIKIRNLYQKWSRLPGVDICKVGYERYGAMTDEDYFRMRMREEDISLGEFIILNWTRQGGQSKKDRVQRLEPDFRRHRFLLPATIYQHGETRLWRYEGARIKTESMSRKIILPGLGDHVPDLEIAGAGLTSNMRRAHAMGNAFLCAKPIIARNEDKELYDVTLALLDEMLLFPFAPKDDLVDAVSRIYDMGATTPAMHEDREVEKLERALADR